MIITITRTNGVAFVIDGAAYLTCGESGSLRSDTWKYYPATDLWENVAKFKGTARTATASFSSGEKGFVVSGKSGTTQFDDIGDFTRMNMTMMNTKKGRVGSYRA